MYCGRYALSTAPGPRSALGGPCASLSRVVVVVGARCALAVPCGYHCLTPVNSVHSALVRKRASATESSSSLSSSVLAVPCGCGGTCAHSLFSGDGARLFSVVVNFLAGALRRGGGGTARDGLSTGTGWRVSVNSMPSSIPTYSDRSCRCNRRD